jgi:prevent-host-death family protein
MKSVWNLQEAGSHFDRLVEDALSQGPQYVVRKGNETVLVISVKEYKDIISDKLGFREFLLSCPRMDEAFEIERQKDFPRYIEL